MAIRARLLCYALAAAATTLPAQQQHPEPAYNYEVVSIHPAAPGQMNSGFSPGAQGGMRARNVTALQVLTFAYGVQDYQFADVPGWARSLRYEISFTPDRPEIEPGRDTGRAAMDGWLSRQRQRMQAVLRDRFRLALREESKELPIYVLTVAKKGHKLQPPEHPERGQSMNVNNSRQLIATTATMKKLADILSMILGRPVRDQTGLDGAYDFKMEWAPECECPAGLRGLTIGQRRAIRVRRSLPPSRSSSVCVWNPERGRCRFSSSRKSSNRARTESAASAGSNPLFAR
jgi:uncharacterized protein (TIGR03435 family)